MPRKGRTAAPANNSPLQNPQDQCIRQALQYIAERGQLPFRPVLMTEEDEAVLWERTGPRIGHTGETVR